LTLLSPCNDTKCAVNNKIKTFSDLLLTLTLQNNN
jgi:hypothetical protein